MIDRTTNGRLTFLACAALFLSLMAQPLAFSQAPSPAAHVSMDGTKMGAYRALIELSYRACESGDYQDGVLFLNILDAVWDKAEEIGGKESLNHTHPALFSEIDRALDVFKASVVAVAQQKGDQSKVKSAYENLLEKLKLAN